MSAMRRKQTLTIPRQNSFLQDLGCALSSPMRPPPKIRFTPARLKARHDGWTAARQFRFIEELAATKSVTRACTVVGMSRESAYMLRDRPEAASGFAKAWKAALAPDFGRPHRISPGAAGRLRRGLKVDEVEKVEGPPDSSPRGGSASSALETLQALLHRLRTEPASPPPVEAPHGPAGRFPD